MVKRIKNLIRNINYLTKHSLWDQREEDIVYLTNKILDDGVYEYGLELSGYEKLHILDLWDSIEYIAKTNKSFVRFCDGEINLMKGMSQPFQEYDKELVDRLYILLERPNSQIAIGINKDYFVPLYNAPHNSYDRRHSYDFRRFFYKYCNKDAIYIDGSFTFWTFGEHSEQSEKFWNTWKEMFLDKKIAIICGKGILDELEYDVFELCKERQFVYGPRKHAWRMHKEIINEIISTVEKDTLLVFILGMAGKAMIPEVSGLGYTAWDIGHLAKGYNIYMKDEPYSEESVKMFFSPD